MAEERKTSDSGDSKYYVQMKSIVKSFGGVHALKNAQLSLRQGEIHAIVGENGAGKSTLIKILSGAHPMDSGEILIAGEKINIDNPKDGKEKGISVIYQEFALARDLTVAENIYIEDIAKRKIINWSKMFDEAKLRLEKLGFGDIDVRKKVDELTVAYQQVVEICKALTGNEKVLVLDEPTAVLTNNEVERLFTLLSELRNQNVCIVYVSHRLEEIFEIADCITIMKDGEYVETVNTTDITEEQLVTKMIGRELSDMFPKRSFSYDNKVVFSAENIVAGSMVQNISFDLHAGEVLGFSGLIGSGRTETMRALFGADKISSGTITVNGETIHIKNPKSAIRHGLGMLPEDRKAQGVLLDMPILHNITLSSLSKFTSYFGVIRRKRERAFARDIADSLTVKAANIDVDVSTLSGGNQQKVSLAKWLAADCKVLILDEPTRGVDVGAKTEIYKVINELARQGIGIIMISSEMPEIIGMCDSVVVMQQGFVAGVLEKKDITEDNMIRLAMGVN